MLQPNATPRNADMSIQRELPVLSPVSGPSEVDTAIIKKIDSEAQAIAMCFNLSGVTLDTLHERLGVHKGTLSKVVRGKQPLPRRVSRIKFMQACGNLLPMQWEAWKSGYELVDAKLLQAIAQRAA